MKFNRTIHRSISQGTDNGLSQIVKWDGHLRRHFLKGAGGMAMALPLLPSLLPREARAQTRQKSFIAIPILNHIPDAYNASEAEAKVTPASVMPSLVGMTPSPVAGRHTINFKSLADAKAASANGQISELIDAAYNPLL